MEDEVQEGAEQTEALATYVTNTIFGGGFDLKTQLQLYTNKASNPVTGYNAARGDLPVAADFDKGNANDTKAWQIISHVSGCQ